MPAKKPWDSATVWVNLLMALAAFVPYVREEWLANPQVTVAVMAGVNWLLRLKTKQPMTVK